MEFSKEQRLAIVVLVGLGLVAVGIGSARRHFVRPQQVEFVQSSALGEGNNTSSDNRTTNVEARSSASTPVAIHVAGHVENPGLYVLDPGSRIADAIDAAGGTLDGADLNAINLAAPLEDGVQVYVPTREEIKQASSPSSFQTVTKSPTPGSIAQRASSGSGSSAAGSKLTVPGEGYVNINSAGLGELQRLPGVGPATAQKILDHRAQIGRFRAVEELMDVSGIGPAKFETMRPFVRI